MFSGSLVPIITPFKSGKVDRDGLERVIEYVLGAGSDGLIPCGTTGESATLSHEEHEEVVRLTIAIARRRVPVIAGTGSNSTAEAIRLTKAARTAGADGALLLSPYYNKPTQEGIFQHYKAVAEATAPLPLLVYNIPGRTASKIEASTLARLATVPSIVGVKEATGQIETSVDTLAATGGKFAVFSGEDALNFPILAVGGKGLISAVANVAPKPLADMAHAAAGRWDEARRIHFDLLALVRVLFVETNPIPVKTACSILGLCSAEMRLPLTAMADGNRAKLEQTLRDYKLV